MPTPLAALVALATTSCLTPLVIALLRRRRQLDVPNDRSSHVQPTPRGGGLAVAGGVVLAALGSRSLDGPPGATLLVTALLFGAIGLADDVRSVPTATRFALQCAAAVAATALLVEHLSGPPVWQILFAAGCATWLISYVNAFNFMDGINGISAAQTVLAGAAWVVGGWMQDRPDVVAAGAVVGAAAAGFAPFNFPAARVFLGDVGSYFLGGWIAAGTVVALRVGVAPELALAPVALYLGDTSTTIVRRARAGERWTTAHRSHAYQRLTDLGWSHARTTTTVAALIAGCVTVATVGARGPVPVRAATASVVLAVVAGYVRLPHILQARRVSA